MLARSADEENAEEDEEDEEDEKGEEGPSQRRDAHDEGSEELVLDGVKRDFLWVFTVVVYEFGPSRTAI